MPASPADSSSTKEREPAAKTGAAPRRAGRPAAAVLDLAGITAAALHLIGKNGYDGLTMAALARSLHVAPSALYNHVESKRDVLLLVEDHLTALVDVTAFAAEPWESAVRKWAWSYRDVFAEHTPLIPVIAVLPVTDAPQTLAMYETVSAGFRAAGFRRSGSCPPSLPWNHSSSDPLTTSRPQPTFSIPAAWRNRRRASRGQSGDWPRRGTRNLLTWRSAWGLRPSLRASGRYGNRAVATRHGAQTQKNPSPKTGALLYLRARGGI
ncbi:hypothetical protein AHiyo4_00790 [Arthrobacter sp. Hiyo4]|nr:hypothetical protein AHiyo4_00790 [Arthrobacter sp. Hiyo4]